MNSTTTGRMSGAGEPNTANGPKSDPPKTTAREVILTHFKTNRNSVRYDSVDKNAPIQTIYLMNSFANTIPGNKMPAAIKITVEESQP